MCFPAFFLVISNELVDALMTRDTLHATQESLLMEVEDLSKCVSCFYVYKLRDSFALFE